MTNGNGSREAGDYRVFETAWGWCAAARSSLGVFAFALPMQEREEAEKAIRARAPGAVSVPYGMKGLARQVRRYFEGKPVQFEADLDFTAGTDFQRRVWQQLCLVPYGHIKTYAGLALDIGRPDAARAVAGAVGRNPLPLLVPCHRIVAADGGLGGYSAPGGIETKRALLELEGVPLFGKGEDTLVLGGW